MGELVRTYMYLPKELKEELNRYYSELSGEYESEYGEELEKNRHYDRLVAQYGFETIRHAEVERIRDFVQDLDGK